MSSYYRYLSPFSDAITQYPDWANYKQLKLIWLTVLQMNWGIQEQGLIPGKGLPAMSQHGRGHPMARKPERERKKAKLATFITKPFLK
jgi:hypothetical protein